MEFFDRANLLPPLREIHARLTENARERAILKGLARLHARRASWQERPAESGKGRRERPGD